MQKIYSLKENKMKQIIIYRKKRQKIHFLVVLMGIFFSIALCSCVTTKTSVIITGTTRPAINPNEVKIYVDPPARYETIGVVNASRQVGSERKRQETQDIVINELKSQAAKMGGNGIILMGVGNNRSSGGGVLINNVVVPTTVQEITTQGQVIHVIQE